MSDGPSPPPDKPDAILDAAFHAFAIYGFRRTSMDDIARGAGMSRSALYLHYRNKEDIFRSLAQRYFAQSLADLRAVLSGTDGPAADRLTAAFRAKDGKFMDVVLGTPHGSELMDAGFAISGDLAQQGEAQMVAVLADWLRRRGLPDDLGSAEDMAGTIMAALKGLKASSASLETYRSGQQRLARIIGRALG